MSDLQAAVRDYQAGRLKEALELARRCVGKAGPQEGMLMALIGNIHFKLGERVPAADAFVEAARRQTAKAGEFLKLATTLYLGAGRMDKVAEIGPGAAALNAEDSAFVFDVASACFALGQRGKLEPLLAHLDRADDRHMALIVNTLRLARRFEELRADLSAALEADPDNIFLQASHYAVAREVCDFAAMRDYDRIMSTPDKQPAPRLLSGEAALGRLLWCEDEALNARPTTETGRYAASMTPRVARRPFGAAGERIRVGYLSNDFFDHATMTLFREAMAAHDPERFDVRLFCYTDAHMATQQAKWPRHLREAVVSVGALDDQAAADRIASHDIDILVDLKGHTMGARLGILNRSDAPVKVTYLGFPGSVAGVDLDYAITDPVVTPDPSKPFYAEKLCRLPETYQANNWRTRPLPEADSRAAHGLPADAFVFASFNATYKITPRAFDLWVRVLKAVPGSVFWIMLPVAHAAENFLAAMEEAGIGRDRVVVCGMVPYPRHISRLPLADLGLDTMPYNGHTTTSDMLWAGLPLVALKGQAFAARVSESLLGAIGLPDLVVETEDAYVDLAKRLAENPELLAGYRARLNENRLVAPLFDAERFVRHLECGYELMAERARSGLTPEHIDVPPLPPRDGPFGERP